MLKKSLTIGAILVLLCIAGLLAVLFQFGKIDRPSVVGATETASAVITLIHPGPSATLPSPGLVVSGKVTGIDGAGVQNVSIYRSYASYPGEVIATTDANGSYTSVFYPIPGDENVTIWAEKSGYTFEPENYHWRHYYGYEHVERSFQVKLP